jgi:hypothetical protein
LGAGAGVGSASFGGLGAPPNMLNGAGFSGAVAGVDTTFFAATFFATTFFATAGFGFCATAAADLTDSAAFGCAPKLKNGFCPCTASKKYLEKNEVESR